MSNFKKREQVFALGTRVRVPGPAAGWRQPSIGYIVGGPEPVTTLQGSDFFYWVAFDVPQHDLSDDGPYERAQILSCYLEAAAANEHC
jgi:hypothetical protein